MKLTPKLLEELLLTDEEIKDALDEVSLGGFEWGKLTKTELTKYRIIAQAQLSAIGDEGYSIVKVDEKLAKLAEDQTFPEFLSLGGLTGMELVTATRQSLYDAGWRKVENLTIALIKGVEK